MKKIYGKPYTDPRRYTVKYLGTDAVRTLVHLHKIEAKLRQEIERDQIYHWTPLQIKARFG